MLVNTRIFPRLSPEMRSQILKLSKQGKNVDCLKIPETLVFML